MLVLTRKKGEVVVFGPKGQALGQVVVYELRGDKVRLGFEVPKDWELYREEVWLAMQKNAEKEKDSEENPKKEKGNILAKWSRWFSRGKS